jgi:hypothetical protein
MVTVLCLRHRVIIRELFRDLRRIVRPNTGRATSLFGVHRNRGELRHGDEPRGGRREVDNATRHKGTAVVDCLLCKYSGACGEVIR